MVTTPLPPTVTDILESSPYSSQELRASQLVGYCPRQGAQGLEAGMGMVTTKTGTNIYCALDLYHHSEKGPHDPGADMLTSHFSEGKTDSERLRISPRVTKLITGNTR